LVNSITDSTEHYQYAALAANVAEIGPCANEFDAANFKRILSLSLSYFGL